MTKSTCLLSVAMVMAVGAAAQAQTAPAPAGAKKSTATATQAAKTAPAATAKDLQRSTAPVVGSPSKVATPQPMRSTAPSKDGHSDCHSKDSDA